MSGYCKTHCCNAGFRTAFSIALAMLVMLVMAGCQNAEDEINLAEHAGDEQHAGDEEPERPAIELKPKDSDTIRERGWAQFSKGDLTKALADLSRAEVEPLVRHDRDLSKRHHSSAVLLHSQPIPAGRDRVEFKASVRFFGAGHVEFHDSQAREDDLCAGIRLALLIEEDPGDASGRTPLRLHKNLDLAIDETHVLEDLQG